MTIDGSEPRIMSGKEEVPAIARPASPAPDTLDESHDVVHTGPEFAAIQTARERSDTFQSQQQRPSVARRSSSRRYSESQGIVGRVRGLSISKILDANPAPGMWAATGAAIAQAPNLTQLQDPHLADNISFNAQGHSVRKVTVPEEAHEEANFSGLGRVASIPMNSNNATLVSEIIREDRIAYGKEEAFEEGAINADGTPASGKKHRKKHNWLQVIGHGLKAFWKFFITPSGFLITIYGLNVVAWGAMLFFLLLNAAPAMNHPSADDDYSPRKIWLEIDSQILNALFCVTGFGLIPWRFMDLYLLLSWRFRKNKANLKKLADKNVSWYRLSEDMSEPKLTATGKHAKPTKSWKLDACIWLMCMNTFLQAVLCGFMWGYNRFDRPSWATGTFIALGCGTAMVAGIITWWEGRKVKIIEGPAIAIDESNKEGSEVDLIEAGTEIDSRTDVKPQPAP